MIRSNALRSTDKSRRTGKAEARHGSIHSSSPSENSRICNWQVVVILRGPWAVPLTIIPHMPQIPSRQSWSKAIGSCPVVISASLTTSSISRNDISADT
jgi:hypothetical protein